MKRFVSSGITSLAIVLAVASLAWAQNGGNNQGNNQGNNNGNAGPAAAGVVINPDGVLRIKQFGNASSVLA